jgi:hypothetical protein
MQIVMVAGRNDPNPCLDSIVFLLDQEQGSPVDDVVRPTAP